MSLTNLPIRRWVAVVAFAAWIPQIANFWPGPTSWPPEKMREDFRQAVEMTKRFPEDKTLQANREAFEALAEDPQPLIRELWIGWVEQVILVLLGITSGLMAWRAVRFWRWAIVATALGYFWLYSWPASLAPMWHQANTFQQLSQSVLLYATKIPSFAFGNFVAPLLLLVAIVLVAIELRQFRVQMATSNRTMERDARKGGARPSL